jgi:photosystem II stability/assembly factor-like uncharacterized protein
MKTLLSNPGKLALSCLLIIACFIPAAHSFAQAKQYSNIVKCIAVSGNHVAAGTEFGVFVSTDNGLSWAPRNQGLDNYKPITKLAISGDTIIAEIVNALWICYGSEKWERLGLLLPSGTFQTFAINNGKIYVSKNLDLFISSDFGKTWTSKIAGLPDRTMINNLYFHEKKAYTLVGSKNELYELEESGNWKESNMKSPAEMFLNTKFSNDKIVRSGFRALFLSADEGKSWKNLQKTLDKDNIVMDAWIDIDGVYAITTKGLFLTSDEGKTWKQTGAGLAAETYYKFFAKSGAHMYLLTNGNVLLQSSDKGQNWQNIESRIIAEQHKVDEAFANKMAQLNAKKEKALKVKQSFDSRYRRNNVRCLVSTGNRLLSGMEDGINVSDDDGVTWSESSSGLPEKTVVHCIYPDKNRLLAGTRIGIFESKDNGSSWERFSADTSLNVVCIIRFDSLLFAGTYKSGMIVSRDDGRTWSQSLAGTAGKNISTLFTSGKRIYAGTYNERLLVSNDNGEHWRKKANFNAETVTTIAANDSLILMTSFNKLMKGLINTENFAQVADDHTYSDVRTVICTKKYIIQGTSGDGIYRSPDGGYTWTQQHEGLGHDEYIVLLTAHKGKIYALAMDMALYVSENEGDTWKIINQGIDQTPAMIIKNKKRVEELEQKK